MNNPNQALTETIEKIEAAYEFMLAYAAQGRDREDPGAPVRQFLGDLSTALGNIGDHLAACLAQSGGDTAAFQAVLTDLRIDAAKARNAVDLTLSLPVIGSQLIDNLNASMHLRALLTDMFLIDEALKAAG